MSDILNKATVLVLNRNWQAINIRTPAEAFCQMATNVATALEIEGGTIIQPSGYEHLGDLMRKLGPGPVEFHLFNANGSHRDFSEYNKAVDLIESRSKTVGE